MGDVATIVCAVATLAQWWAYCIPPRRRWAMYIYAHIQNQASNMAQTTHREDMIICPGLGSRVGLIMPQRLPQYVVEFMGGPKYQFIFGYRH